MELFLDDSTDSFFLSLLTFYLKLDTTGLVKPIRLSVGALKAAESGAFLVPNVPSLITEHGAALRAPVMIA